MKIQMSPNGRILLFLTLALLLFAVFPILAGETAQKKAIGMILEVKGKANVTNDGKRQKAYMMSPIYSESILSTGKNSNVVLVCFADNKEYKMQSYSAVRFNNGKAVAVAGSVSPLSGKQDLPLPKNTSIRSRQIMGEVPGLMLRESRQASKAVEEEATAPEVLYMLVIPFKWQNPKNQNYSLTMTEVGTTEVKKPFPMDVGNSGEYTFRNIKGAPFQLQYRKTYKAVLTGADGEEKTSYYQVVPECTAKEICAARGRFLDIIKKDPNDTKAYFLMAQVFENYGLYQRALEVMGDLQTRDPQNPYVYYYMAQLYEKMGNNGERDKLIKKGNALEEGAESK